MIKYKIKKVNPNIIAIVVPDDYDRCMLFCRAQEFYESAGKQFVDSKFSIWDYFKWYSKKYSDCFSYTKDFVGFNFPLIVAKKCYELNEIETPYDAEMIKIIEDLWINGEKKYIIGVDSLSNSTFDHEMAHALYYTDIEYKVKMDEITERISKVNLDKFKENLYALGYCKKVVKDEIQAYMATEIDKKITKGIVNKKKLFKQYNLIFKKYKNPLID